MAIDGYSIGGYWCLLMAKYQWLLVVIISVAIGGYCISGYW